MKKKIIGGLSVSFCVLLFTELLLMGLGYGIAYKPDLIGWRMPMNLINHTMTDERNQNQFIVNTNEDGLRTKISKDKPTGLTRIALLGDSTVFGWGVSDDESLAEQFEQILQKNISPGDNVIEVLNAAQPGYSSTQLHALYLESIQNYKPDWIIAFPPFHDFTPALVSDWEAINGPKWTRVLMVGLAGHSRIFNILHSLIKKQHTDELLENPTPSMTLRVNDQERSKVYSDIKNISQEWGGTLVMGAFVFGKEIQENSQLSNEYPLWDWMKAFSVDTGTSILDLRWCCVEKNIPYLISGDPGHLNPQGNKNLAQKLAIEWRTFISD